ncbi:unnamed protein product [Polarella glacialis]|uniref:Uncharacterized protein n=1 Tax=Polarella glacialis TaxID=89957 RepID=A0A813JMS3_POLGL|nr:unnamed protein product [Polarella glacialis]CAE8684091.1 unnamed protein product [Polarella glacialis]
MASCSSRASCKCRPQACMGQIAALRLIQQQQQHNKQQQQQQQQQQQHQQQQQRQQPQHSLTCRFSHKDKQSRLKLILQVCVSSRRAVTAASTEDGQGHVCPCFFIYNLHVLQEPDDKQGSQDARYDPISTDKEYTS